jgi:hypothetical protein
MAEWIRETAAKETYLGPHELRGLAKRYLLDATSWLEDGFHQHAHNCTSIAADLQQKALELENRYALNRLNGGPK